MKPIPAIILVPLIAHPVWAALMLTAPIPIHTIGIDATYSMFPNPLMAAFAMFAASVLAWLSHLEFCHGNWRGFALIGFQQFLMLLSLWTVIVAVATGTYANHYAPPEGWRFIAADQVLFAICAVLHTMRIIRIYILKKP